MLSIALGSGASTDVKEKAGFAFAGDDPRNFLTGFAGATRNLPEFENAAHGIGAFNWVADRDQVVRRVALVFRLNQAFVPSLSVEALRVAQGATTYVLKASNASGETAFGQSTGLNHIRVGDVEVPTDAGGGVYLKFRHFDKKSYIPAWKVLAGEVPQEEIEGRIILIGTSAPGLLDLRATPVDEAIAARAFIDGQIPRASRLRLGARTICRLSPRDRARVCVAEGLSQKLSSHWLSNNRPRIAGRLGSI